MRAICSRLILLLSIVLPFCSYAQSSGSWALTGAMNTGRYAANGVLLTNGRVLIAGGNSASAVLASAEVYDPTTGSWSATGAMRVARSNYVAVRLANGKVLVAGGCTNPNCSTTTASAELYDPATGLWSTTASMKQMRYFSAATVLIGGKVLVEGGCNAGNCNSSTNTAEIYDPASATWTYTGSLTNARDYHTATMLANGTVLVAGGYNPSSTAEVYDPIRRTWSPTGAMVYPQALHTATLLGNGKVLSAGGMQGYMPGNLCQIYDPATNSWSSTGSLNTKRDNHGAVLLINGKVLVAGGSSYSRPRYYKLASAELYDRATGTWSFTGSMSTARYQQTMVTLSNGRVLAVGGLSDTNIPLTTAETYTP